MDSSDTVAVVSLVIAIIAFFIATAQALQQYLSTADGYQRCAESVMGPWVQHRKRVFRLNELRFGVIFQTPVFFVATPENDRGPIVNQRVINVDGTDTSRERSLTRAPTKYGDAKKAGDDPGRFASRVHTANDERASWVTLLELLQQAASESRSWDTHRGMTPKGMKYDVPSYSICVQLQGRLKNWDFMPDGLVRPYATTTVCHIAEMATLLGMSWKAFNPDDAILRAEGNGLALSSSTFQGLGTVVTFMVFGRSKFASNRVIPAIEIKDLLFGIIPTIFKNQNLIFGDDKGSQRTLLKFLRCKQETFRKYTKVEKHLRSVNFEIIAMLGKTIRIRGSNFNRLPNPTRDPWVDTFSSCALMVEFKRNVSELRSSSPKVQFILNAWEKNLQPVWKETEDQIDIDMREAVHNVLDSCDDFLINQCGQAHVISVVSAHVAVVVEELYDSDSLLSTIDSDNEKELVDHYFEKIRPKVVELSAGYETPRAGSPSMLTEDGSLVSREDVWLMLQFRMCCWWVLHEFEQADNCVALEPRWRDSRLPVHIL